MISRVQRAELQRGTRHHDGVTMARAPGTVPVSVWGSQVAVVLEQPQVARGSRHGRSVCQGTRHARLASIWTSFHIPLMAEVDRKKCGTCFGGLLDRRQRPCTAKARRRGGQHTDQSCAHELFPDFPAGPLALDLLALDLMVSRCGDSSPKSRQPPDASRQRPRVT